MFSKVYTGILQSEIPLGGWGRRLTVKERTKLARHGVPSNAAYIVVRLDAASPNTGRLYMPISTDELHTPLDVILS